MILIKLGGRAAENHEALAALAEEIAGLTRENRVLLVHGGGAEVTALSQRLGIEAVFKDGVRQTSPAEMDIVDMVLAGRVNSHLVRLFSVHGLRAVGVRGADGGTITARALGGTRTGEVAAIDTRFLELLMANGYFPVLCPTATDERGAGLNLNADTVAFALAGQLAAVALVFLSDIPGVLAEGSVIQTLAAKEARALIARGVITGGMVPKIGASLEAMEQGVRKVIIGQYDGPGALSRLLEGKQGTRLWT
jgi:acetylglutamate kinase